MEFPKILQILSEFCNNTETKERALNLKPLNDEQSIQVLLDQLEEMVSLSMRSGKPPLTKINSITEALKRSKLDSTLTTNELLDIAVFLRVLKDLKYYYQEDLEIRNEDEHYWFIDDLFLSLNDFSSLESEISRKIIGPEEIDDHASENLFKIRKEIEKKMAENSRILERIIHSKQYENYLQEPIISVRNNRHVIPVKLEYKNKIKGNIIDYSCSGQTVYIEPIQAFNLKNELRELEIKEREEIERILRDLTQKVSFYQEEIAADYNSLIEIDFLSAKAEYALSIDANPAKFSHDQTINLKKARHPLIPLDKVVASDFTIDSDTRTVVITGPNTGGKTVSLKTFGLLSLMLQSGLFIPVQSGSTTRLFTNIFADIGDEQSIEQSLSTFSSHLTNIVSILKKADSNSLILLDELGAGTDPVEGAALAISILEETKRKKALTFASTHYAELKEYAVKEDQVTNASMIFDVKTLSATYKLVFGIAGSSNAFDIARNLGLSEDIIQNSKDRISQNQRDFDALLKKTQKDQEEIELKKLEINQLLKKVEADNQKAQKRLEKSKQIAERTIKKAEADALKIVDTTKKQTDIIYKKIQDIQKNTSGKIDNKELEKLRHSISKTKDVLETDLEKKETVKTKSYTIDDFKKGDRVLIKSLNKEARVSKILKNNKIEVQAGSIRISYDVSELEPILKKKEPQIVVSHVKRKMDTRLDLRGKSFEEASLLTASFIGEALLLGEKRLEIIHGFGTGKVRQAVHNYLKGSKQVSSYRLGGPGEGGAGVTVVEL